MSDPILRLATVLARFSDMKPEQTIAATATADGGAEHLTYGDLKALLAELLTARERLDRLCAWHVLETGPGGTVGRYCAECNFIYPCDTKRMAEGTWVDSDELIP